MDKRTKAIRAVAKVRKEIDEERRVAGRVPLSEDAWKQVEETLVSKRSLIEVLVRLITIFEDHG